jgi:hypothetical protein
MAERGIRWIRLALYFVGALGLTALAFVLGLGRGKPSGRPAASLPDASQAVKPDTLPTRPPATQPSEPPPTAAGTPEAKRRIHLRPQVRKPKDPPTWDSFDNSDMNLE